MSSETPRNIRIMIIDDEVLLCEGLVQLLERHTRMSVVGHTADKKTALEIAAIERPDIVLLDSDLQGCNVVELIPELLAAANNIRILILTESCDPELRRQEMRVGALGVVSKMQPGDVLIKAIEKVYDGEIWLDRAMTARLLNEMVHARKNTVHDVEELKIHTLTQREREIVALIGLGLKNKQIAERLFISEATARNHLTSILSKLELSDRFELAIYAYRHKLAKPPE